MNITFMNDLFVQFFILFIVLLLLYLRFEKGLYINKDSK